LTLIGAGRPVEGGLGRTCDGRPPRRVVIGRIVARSGRYAARNPHQPRTCLQIAFHRARWHVGSWRSDVVLRGRRAGRPCGAPFRGMECRHETERAIVRRPRPGDRHSASGPSPGSLRRRWRDPTHPPARTCRQCPYRGPASGCRTCAGTSAPTST
jgi:hypothetical protein